MKVGVLPFVIAGLFSGGLSWWLAIHLPAPLLFAFFFGPVYPGVIIALTLLVLGKLIGVTSSGNIFIHAVILIVASILAQELILLALGVQDIVDAPIDMSVLELYPTALLNEDELLHLANSELLFFWLPTPIAGGVQLYFISIGVKIVWKLPNADPLIAAIYGAFFALLTALFSSSVYEHIEYILHNSEGTLHHVMLWIFGNMGLIVSPLLWHLLIFMAIYMAARPQSNSAVSTADANDKLEQGIISDDTSS